MNVEILAGTCWIAEDRVIEIDGLDSHSVVTARDVVSGNMVKVPTHLLKSLSSRCDQPNPLAIPEKEWSRCANLARQLQPYTDRHAMPARFAEAIAAQYGITKRHLQRLRAKFCQDPRTTALVRKPGGRAAGSSFLLSAVDSVILRMIAKHYARREPISKAELLERVRSVCRRTGLPPPSRNAVLARITAQEGYALDCKRQGTKTAKQHWEPRPGQLTALEPLAMMQIDHTLVDIMVLSRDRSQVLGRPWLTVAIDVATRVVLGIYLSMDAPSATSVSLCIEHAVLPKIENEHDPGLWPMYGKPKVILVDNGKDFRSFALKRGCQEHGIELRWRPVRQPHYGAHIERMMGTLMRFVHGLRGTTFSNSKQRGDYPSEARATMTLDELRTWLVLKICKRYHLRKHRSLGMPPLLAWEHAWTAEGGQIMLPSMVPRPLDFRMDFLPFVMRRMQRTGIQFASSRYWDDGLIPLVRPGREVMVRYDPRDLTRIWVRRDDQLLVEAPVVAGRALTGRSDFRVDSETQARLDEGSDEGQVECDQLEDDALKATRRHRAENKARDGDQSRGKRGGRKAVANKVVFTEFDRPDAPPDSTSIQIEELEP